MMAHLEPSEIVDYVDGGLTDTQRRHMDTCDWCRERAAALRATTADARDDEIPEPSPLFWDHFSARVREAIDRDQQDLRSSWQRSPLAMWATAAAFATVLLLGMFWHALMTGPAPDAPEIATTSSSSESDLASVDLAPGDLENDEAWALVRSFAEELDADGARAAGLTARPGSAEGLALELSVDERRELARLIEIEMNRRGV